MNEIDCWSQFETLASESMESALDFLDRHFRDSSDYHRLFDVLKMKIRHSLGLPLLHSEGDPELDQKTQNQLEDKLLEACRELAQLFFEAGNLNEGWIYLQPVGDAAFGRKLIRDVEVNEETTPSIIDIAFHQGVDPAYGYQILIQETGTCNGITAFDVHAMQLERPVVAELSSVLLNHFYDEVLTNVSSHIADQNLEQDDGVSSASTTETSPTLGDLLDQHSWLVREGGHHIDATHLASVIRIARQTLAKSDHQKALELSNYGCRLDSDYQFASDPPFQEIYEDHRIFYQALTGIEVENAIQHFTDKADSLKGEYHEGAAVEALIDLQIRTGDRDSAVQTTIERLWQLVDPGSLPPSAFEIPKTSGQFEAMASAFKSQSNFAGFAFSKLRALESS
jgi:hypothetical protein